MSHYVGKILKIRPNDILDHWGVPELIVAYGYYANETSYKNFLETQEQNKHQKNKTKLPEPYTVRFMSLNEE